MSVITDLREFAHEIGLDLVGVASADSLPDAEEVMLKRIGDGLFGGLDWFTPARAQRACNPRLLLPSATSIISFGVPYLVEPPIDRPGPGVPQGRISRYAWGEDYHEVLREKIGSVVDFLKQRVSTDVRSRIFVDSGPLAERAFAARSAIGWFGKNTNIITRDFGSWLFLGEILVDIDLECDRPLKKTCGTCEVCLKSCPTGAILSPYTVDNRRCISYLTIELKGPIPRELRPLMGDRVFGCDACQEACPVNRKAQVRKRSLFGLLVDPFPDLIQLLMMSDEEYRTRFRASPVHRAKKRGLQRNAAVALGNCGDPSAVLPLVEALGNEEELVRGHAAWALGHLGGNRARKALEMHRRRQDSPYVLAEIEDALMVSGL